MKKRFREFILTALIGGIAACLLMSPVKAASSTMKIVAIDLGAANTGEAVMISDEGGNSLLVDSGDNRNKAVFDWLSSNGYKNRKFDTLVTHWHDDHAGNTAQIIRKYRVGTVYIPPLDYLYEEDTKYYRYERAYAKDILKAAKERKTRVVYLKEGQTISVGSVTGKVIYCCGSPASENWYAIQYINNQSAAIMFTGGGSRFLTAGDLQAQGEKRLINSGFDLSADILKLDHHGYDRSNTQGFLDAVDPTYAYFTSHEVTTGNYMPGNVKDSASRMGKTANVMSTRYNGTITYTCMNGEISVKAGRNVKKMYQRLVNKSTGKSRVATYTFNKQSTVHMKKKILNTDKYYNYQLNANGTTFTGGWSKLNGSYYLGSGGIYAYNTFAVKNGKTYWFDFYGRRFERGFKNAYGRRYYFTPHRVAGWKTVDGRRYYFMDKKYTKYSRDLEGMMMTGFKVVSGKPYYLQDARCGTYTPADSGMLMAGFYIVGGNTYYGADSSMKGYTPSEYGVIQKNWKKINGHVYYMGSDGVVRKGWQTINGKRYYMHPGGAVAIDEFVDIDGKTYYFDKSGVLQTGLITVNDKSYYMGTDGAMQKGLITAGAMTYYADENGVLQKGLVTVGGKQYLFGDDYAAVTGTGWHKIGENDYYILETGTAAIGFTDIEGKCYYFNEEGIMQRGIVSVDDRAYYFDPDGVMQTGLIESDEGRYYADEEGVLQKGIVVIDGAMYLFGDDYAMVTEPGWISVESGRYYILENGAFATGFVDLDGERYYFGDDCTVSTGQFEVDGNIYCADEDGMLQKGIIETEDGKRLFGDDYAMITDSGWHEVNGDSYYITEGGAFAEGLMEIDGKMYHFLEDGKLDPNFTEDFAESGTEEEMSAPENAPETEIQ